MTDEEFKKMTDQLHKLEEYGPWVYYTTIAAWKCKVCGMESYNKIPKMEDHFYLCKHSDGKIRL